ncbi:polysaccharide deacetylase family protein [Edaphobacter bradus]|uniref:polysaccharide deacetylase family protein n=1 Tax=Edaphobacter bradus TaxID=2259016 RepID=UPI0021DFA94E|nr:polysaccharide deacetylase family protein [Edaphobacter bradus]
MFIESASRAQTEQARRSLFLLYHELRPAKSDYSYVVETTVFEKHLELFSQLRRENACLVPEVTFDDGHLSNFEFAMPLLQSHKMTAQFFVTVGWTDRKHNYMGWRHLRELHQAGHAIGAHGWSHKLLTHCSKEDLQIELAQSKEVLEDHLSAPIVAVSLPGGRFNQRVLEACGDAGYTQIFTSIPRAEHPPLGIVGRLNVRNEWTLDWISEIFQTNSSRLQSLEREYRRKELAKRVLGDNLYARLWALVNRQESINEDEAPKL